METTIVGLYRDCIRVVLGLYWGYMGLYRDNAKEHGNYYSI